MRRRLQPSRETLHVRDRLARLFGLTDAVVVQLGEIVHDLGSEGDAVCAPEGPAVGRMVEGLRLLHPGDPALLEQGIAMFEALARSFESSAPRRPKKRAARAAPKERKVKRARH
jgi:hypothetical protein